MPARILFDTVHYLVLFLNEKNDLFYHPMLSYSDYIEMEKSFIDKYTQKQGKKDFSYLILFYNGMEWLYIVINYGMCFIIFRGSPPRGSM